MGEQTTDLGNIRYMTRGMSIEEVKQLKAEETPEQWDHKYTESRAKRDPSMSDLVREHGQGISMNTCIRLGKDAAIEEYHNRKARLIGEEA